MDNAKLLEERYPDAGVRLERVNAITIWAAHPGVLHQETVFRIQPSVKSVAHDAEGGKSIRRDVKCIIMKMLKQIQGPGYSPVPGFYSRAAFSE